MKVKVLTCRDCEEGDGFVLGVFTDDKLLKQQIDNFIKYTKRDIHEVDYEHWDENVIGISYGKSYNDIDFVMVIEEISIDKVEFNT